MKKLFFLAVGIGILFTSCNPANNDTDKAYCPVEQLLLDQSDYPSGTILNVINSPIDEKPKESASRTANYNANGAGQIVIRYATTDKTLLEYNEWKKSVFAPSEVYGSWEMPSTFSGINLNADRYQIACGNVISFGNRCFMIGQYEEYYVFFRADISGTGITHGLFRDLVLKIDNEMSSCLDR